MPIFVTRSEIREVFETTALGWVWAEHGTRAPDDCSARHLTRDHWTGRGYEVRAVEIIEEYADAAHVLAASAEEVAPPAPHVPSYDEEDYWARRATIRAYTDSKGRT